jgi:hypothetical protein
VSEPPPPQVKVVIQHPPDPDTDDLDEVWTEELTIRQYVFRKIRGLLSLGQWRPPIKIYTSDLTGRPITWANHVEVTLTNGYNAWKLDTNRDEVEAFIGRGRQRPADLNHFLVLLTAHGHTWELDAKRNKVRVLIKKGRRA